MAKQACIYPRLDQFDQGTLRTLDHSAMVKFGEVWKPKRLGQDDARDVRVVSRVTPSPGNDRTLLQQLFGNLGRLGPGLGAGANTSVGAPSPTAR